ncbi:MAG: hypothetical protein QM817_12095 [Archangium sp.]
MSASNGKIGAEASQAAAGARPPPEGEDSGRWDAAELADTLQHAAKTANSAINGVSDAVGLTEKVEKAPYAMVGAALGLGYVVGGGLFTPTTARLVRMAMKLTSIPMVRDRLLDVAEAAIDGVLQNAAKKDDSSK